MTKDTNKIMRRLQAKEKLNHSEHDTYNISRARYIQHTNVDDVAVLVDHDVAIVPVFDLEDVADQGVGRHALDEVGTGLPSAREGETA